MSRVALVHEDAYASRIPAEDCSSPQEDLSRNVRSRSLQASAKQEMEERGEAAKAQGVPQSRRLSSRAGGTRAESKSDNLATGKNIQ